MSLEVVPLSFSLCVSLCKLICLLVYCWCICRKCRAWGMIILENIKKGWHRAIACRSTCSINFSFSQHICVYITCMYVYMYMNMHMNMYMVIYACTYIYIIYISCIRLTYIHHMAGSSRMPVILCPWFVALILFVHDCLPTTPEKNNPKPKP